MFKCNIAFEVHSTQLFLESCKLSELIIIQGQLKLKSTATHCFIVRMLVFTIKANF